MATKTSNYEFNKPEQNDFYDVDVQNENWDKVDEELSEFDDSGVTEDIKSFPDFLSKFVTGNKVAITLRNLKAGLQFVLHAGQIVNNCVTDNTGLPLSAAQGKALKDLIDTTNNNLSKCLQYIHSETDVFDFNDPKTPAGYHRLGAAASYKNAPSGLDGVNFCTVEVVRPTISDTLAMTIYPYKKGINPPVWYKSGGSNEWPTLPWNVYATKSDLSNMTKKDSSKFMPGDTVLDVSAWSAITLLSIVTYKDEATALYLIRKESSNKIYCIPVKSSTQVSVTHNGENKLTLSNSATYGGTWAVLFLS